MAGLLVQREPRGVSKEFVSGEEGCAVGVASIVKRVTGRPASEPQLRGNSEQLVAYRNHSGGLDRFLKALAPSLAELGDERP